MPKREVGVACVLVSRRPRCFTVALGAVFVRVGKVMASNDKSFAAPNSELDLPGLEHEILKFCSF